MKFLIDENLPAALAHWLIAQGHEAEHTSAAGLNRTPDAEIARKASKIQTVIVTKDSDYFSFPAGMQAPRVVHLGVRNASTAELLEICGAVWPDVVSALEAGDAGESHSQCGPRLLMRPVNCSTTPARAPQRGL